MLEQYELACDNASICWHAKAGRSLVNTIREYKSSMSICDLCICPLRQTPLSHRDRYHASFMSLSGILEDVSQRLEVVK